MGTLSWSERDVLCHSVREGRRLCQATVLGRWHDEPISGAAVIVAVRLLMCVDGEMYGVLWSQLSPAKATSALEVLSAVAASDTVPRALRILEAFLQVWGNASDHIAAETPHLTH